MHKEIVKFQLPDGVQLVGDVMGPEDGEPVILQHGGGQTRQSWRQTLDVIAGLGFRCYSLDARGHGESGFSPDGDYTLGTFVDDLRFIMKQIGGAPILVGASLGGLVSILTAGEAAPGAVKALVMVDVAVSTNPYGVKRIQDFMRANPDGFANIDEAVDAVAAYASHRPRPTNTKGLERNLRKVGDRYYWHWDPKFLDSFDGSHVASQQRLHEAAKALDIPVLLIHASESDVLGQKEVDELLSLTPHAQYVKIGDAGHMVVGDKNSTFNQAIIDFIEPMRG